MISLELPLLLSGMLCLIIAAVCLRPTDKAQWSHFRMAFLIDLVSMLLLPLPFAYPQLQLGNHNWTGKLLSIGASYSIIWFVRGAAPARQFLTVRQTPGSLPGSMAISLILLLAAIAFTLATGGDHGPTLETVLFEASVPAIDEEGVFRAGMMGCLIAATGPSRRDRWQVKIIAVALTSGLFGLMHAVHYTPHGHFSYDAETFAITATIGTLLALLTVHSGSILLPILLHNAANCLNFVF